MSRLTFSLSYTLSLSALLTNTRRRAKARVRNRTGGTVGFVSERTLTSGTVAGGCGASVCSSTSLTKPNHRKKVEIELSARLYLLTLHTASSPTFQSAVNYLRCQYALACLGIAGGGVAQVTSAHFRSKNATSCCAIASIGCARVVVVAVATCLSIAIAHTAPIVVGASGNN